MYVLSNIHFNTVFTDIFYFHPQLKFRKRIIKIIILLRNFVKNNLYYNQIIEPIVEVFSMKTRKHPLGNNNLVGANIARLRKQRNIKQKDFISKIQTMGVDMNPTSYSKLEGQTRIATDKEIYVIAKLLNVDINELFSSK